MYICYAVESGCDGLWQVRRSSPSASVTFRAVGTPQCLPRFRRFVDGQTPFMLLSLEGGDIKRDDKDVLPRQKCLDALAALRHAKWFQVHSPTLPNVCALHHPPRFKYNFNNPSYSNMSYDNFASVTRFIVKC